MLTASLTKRSVKTLSMSIGLVVLVGGLLLRDLTFYRTIDILPVSSTTSREETKFSCSSCHEEPRCFTQREEYSNLTLICRKDGKRPECNLNCIDRTRRSVNAFVTTNHTTQIWPPVRTGKFVQNPSFCRQHTNTTQSCLFDSLIWSPTDGQHYDDRQACEILRSANVSRIYVIGDSLMRNLYQSLYMVLSGNYQESLGCAGTARKGNCPVDAFRILHTCQRWWHNHSVEVISQTHNPRKDEEVSLPKILPEQRRTLYLYGVGCHPNRAPMPYDTFRQGILNASAYQDTRWNKYYNESFFWGQQNEFVWIPPHYRLSIGRIDETNERSLTFMLETSRYFQAKGAWTLNTYSLTEAASLYLCRTCDPPEVFQDAKRSCRYSSRESCEPTQETFDGFHYGRDINIIKARLLLKLLRDKVFQSRD